MIARYASTWATVTLDRSADGRGYVISTVRASGEKSHVVTLARHSASEAFSASCEAISINPHPNPARGG